MENKEDYSVGIDVKKVKNVSISRYANGYNYARVHSKIADNEYMDIHYEWEGKEIPEFAMQAMEIMKALGTENASASIDADSAAYLTRAAASFLELAAKAKKK